MSEPSSADYKEVADKIVDETIGRLRGQRQDYCLFDRPRAKYFVSNLAPEKSEDEEGEFSESRPNSIGLRLQPHEEAKSLKIKITFDLFAPSFPTQSEFTSIQETRGDDSQFKLGDRFFRQFDVKVTETVALDDLDRGADQLNRQLAEAITEAINSFRNVHLLCRHTTIEDQAPVDEIDSAEDVQRIREALDGSASSATQWQVDFEITRRERELTLMLTNASEPDEEDRVDEPFVFNPEISVDGQFEAYTFNALPEDYRYNRNIWAKGQNCSATVEEPDVEDLEPGTWATLRTADVPNHQTSRFKHRETLDHATDQDQLRDPAQIVEELNEISDAMWSYLQDHWRDELADRKREELDSDEYNEFIDAADDFEQEIKYFDHGIEVLERRCDVRRAFALMNEAFYRQTDEWSSWRLFQIVFMVSNLGDIAAREYPEAGSDKVDDADVLWFPTGGGKTEAYLGLIVFSLFFDRLRGRGRGVTAWIRFPRRLLATQQKNRFLRTLAAANDVRMDRLDAPGEPFTLGFFMGSHDTPNSIRDGSNGINNYHKSFREDPGELKDQCQVVEECPSCGSAVDVRFDEDINSVFHECGAEQCQYEELPLYVTDHDIYRNVPSVLLGTLDKISIMGYNDRFANLLGNFTTKCPDHGYGYAGTCPENTTIGCDAKVQSVPESEQLDDPVPLLHLIDEVHLLDEELGTFASHYETMYQQLCREIGGEEPKVLTSTATISAYERQMKNLFMKEANRFPEEGPTLEESFYGYIDHGDPERRYLGITPSAKSHIYAVLDLAKTYHQVIRDFRSDPSPSLNVDPDALEQILHMYEVSIVYFLRKTKKDRYRRSIENQIRRDMREEGYETPILPDELTADTDDTEDLEKYTDPSAPFPEREDTIAATSFIGHGIDVDRFNTMFFFGFPSESFEYIQSSARVGRKRPGSVVDVFKPYDERDKHRYKYFEKSHEYLRRSVEPVSVDRWAKDSADKTLPGLIEGLFDQLLRPDMYRTHDLNIGSSSEFRKVLTENDTHPDFPTERFTGMVKSAYGLDQTSDEFFEERVESMIDRYMNYWTKRLKEKPWTTTPLNPMQNLRDIGESEEIDVKNDEGSFYRTLIGGD